MDFSPGRRSDFDFTIESPNARSTLSVTQANSGRRGPRRGNLSAPAVMTIPFSKAHGAQNDFLLTWRDKLPAAEDFAAAAIAICNRNTGVGADGWIVVSPSAEADASIELYNSDGGRSAISGNGTRCAAAL